MIRVFTYLIVYFPVPTLNTYHFFLWKISTISVYTNIAYILSLKFDSIVLPDT